MVSLFSGIVKNTIKARDKVRYTYYGESDRVAAQVGAMRRARGNAGSGSVAITTPMQSFTWAFKYLNK